MVESNQYQPSQDFLAYVKDQEGFKPKCYTVPEQAKDGCNNAIGYGHNIKDNDNLLGKEISENQATEILVNDLRKARSQANIVFDLKFGKGSFNKLNLARQEMLTDFAFNLGSGGLQKFPKFMTAVKDGDIETAKAECLRKFTNKQGVLMPLQKRNAGFIKVFFDSGRFQNEGMINQQAQQLQMGQFQQLGQQFNPRQGQFRIDEPVASFPDLKKQFNIKQFPNDYTKKGATPGKFFYSFLRDIETLREREEEVKRQDMNILGAAEQVISMYNDHKQLYIEHEEAIQAEIDGNLYQEQEMLRQLQQQLIQVNRQIQEKQQDVQRLQDQLREKEQNMQNKERQLEALNEELRVLQEQQFDLQRQEQEKQTQIEERLLELAQTQQMNQEDRQKLQVLEQELEQLRQEIQDLQVRIEQLTREIANLESEIQRLNNEIAQLENEIQGFETEKAKEEADERMHAQNEANLANKCSSLQNKIQGYKMGIAAAEAAIAALSFWSLGLAGFLYAALNMLKQALAGSEQELEQAKLQMEEEKQKKILCGQRARQLQEQIQQANTTLTQKRNELQIAQETKQQKENEREQLQGQLETAKQQQQERVGQLKALTQKISENDQRLQGLERQIGELKYSLEGISAYIQQVVGQIASQNQGKQSLQSEIQTLNTQINDAKRQQNALESQKSALSREINEMQQKQVRHGERKERLINAKEASAREISRKRIVIEQKKAVHN